MTEKDRRLLKKTGAVFFALLIFIYIIYQLCMLAYVPVKTQVACSYTAEDSVDTEIFVVREEGYICSDKKGTVISVAKDGSRVAKNEEVAVIFSDNSAAENYIRLRELEASLKNYEGLAGRSDNYTFDIEGLNKNTDDSVMRLVETVSFGNFSRLGACVDDLRAQIVTRQIATGTELNFEKRLSELRTEHERLLRRNSEHFSVLAPNSGYYISGADGFEKAADCSRIKEYTVDDIRALMKAKPVKPPEGTIGKTVTEFCWYIVCVADSGSIGELETGEKLRVNLPYSTVNSLDATVLAINAGPNEKSALILGCNLMNSEISTLRREKAEILTASYTGLRISPKAVRVNEKGEKGVYVRNGNLVQFKKINIIYSCNEYILSKASGDGNGCLKLYDNVIVEGKDLYDGKIVK